MYTDDPSKSRTDSRILKYEPSKTGSIVSQNVTFNGKILY